MNQTPDGIAPRSSQGRESLIALAIFVASFAVYHASPVTQVVDARFLSATSYSLIESGSFSIPPIHDIRHDDYRVHRSGERIFHWYPNAPAVLNTPFVFVFGELGFPVFEDGLFSRRNETRIFRVAAAFATAMTVAFGYLLVRVFLAPGWALALTFLCAFGTQLYSTASRAYWGHSWGVLLLTLGLYLLLEPRFHRRRLAYLMAATALSWACFCRPTFALSALALTLLLLGRERRRFLPFFAGGGIVWAALFVLYAYSVYGQMLPPYFSGEDTLDSGLSLTRFLQPPLEAVLGTLFSPGRGLFVYTPFFALSLLFPILFWRRLGAKTTALVGLTVILAHWLLICGMREWWGGGCYGPRTFTDVVPWFLVLSALSLETARLHAGGWGTPVKAAWIVSLVVLASWSLFTHTRGAVALETRDWGDRDLKWARYELRRPLFKYQRLNNWRYPQFMAGLVPVPPPERFVSWLCDGKEEVKRVTCGDPYLRIKLSGSPAGAFEGRLSTDQVFSGQLEADGSLVTRLAAPPRGEGMVTVVWECGTVITAPYVCG